MSDENSLVKFDGALEAGPVVALSWILVAVALAMSIASCVMCCCLCCCNSGRPRTPVRAKHVVLTIATIVLVLVSFLAGGYSVAYK